ncbi:protein phosphatase 2C domain-containing protein [Paenibacillus arenosi]|uniref:Protein phosphatase 2C domain-containing protein n=1 Tax=Paenibacillus arenosi TaxID=2774142 RepID=A0ABR9AZU0_9BACL|nr:protein phosphatase 2C domain-containing protein [Paenibacillus arenosi]MBD8499593.1 protein phosphatase 2C domain-containing protein [Paenibacillus arenosi]
MKIFHYNQKNPLKKCSEDAFALNDTANIYAVMDGVTPLDAYRDKNGYNGAYIAANLFKRRLERTEDLLNLYEEIRDTNHMLRHCMEEAKIDMSQKHHLWSTCVAGVQICGDDVHYAQFGDTMIVAIFRDGRIQSLTENHVMGIDKRSRAKREVDRLNGISVQDEHYFEDRNNQMSYHRWMANIPGGYGIANGMEEACEYIQRGTLPSHNLHAILLITDGLFHPEESLEAACKMITQLGFEQYADLIELEERKRGLPADDRTGILIEF